MTTQTIPEMNANVRPTVGERVDELRGRAEGLYNRGKQRAIELVAVARVAKVALREDGVAAHVVQPWRGVLVVVQHIVQHVDPRPP